MVIEHSLRPSVGLSVCPVHCGKMADRIWVRFGSVGRVGPGIWVSVRWGGGNLGGECGTPCCNQWGVCGIAVQSV